MGDDSRGSYESESPAVRSSAGAAPAREDAPCGDGLDAGPARWRFDAAVAERFDTHIERSVPGYRAGHDLVVSLADFFVHEGARVYDLGCSTGTLTRRLARNLPVPRDGHGHGSSPGSADGARVIGIEREPAMATLARQRCADEPRVQIVEADLLEVELEPCSLVIAYYTAQFVRPAVRQTLFDRVYEALDWGGGFVLFEKVRAPDARFQDMVTTLYNDYKRERGFSAEEILGKTGSLKGVLEPFSTRGNLDLLSRAGFVDVTTIWKHVCFEGFLAIK